jgi:hypothetical protein
VSDTNKESSSTAPISATAMTSPSPEEVAKAQEWLAENWPRHAESSEGQDTLPTMLASYAAEQGRPTTIPAGAMSSGMLRYQDQQAEAAECRCSCNPYCGCECHESRLTSLREGLRRLVTAVKAVEVSDDGSHGAAMAIESVESALAEAESLLAGLSPNETKGSTK